MQHFSNKNIFMKALVFLQFEDAVEMNKFLEYGEYDGAYYGTRFDSIRSVIKSGKICILDLNPQVCLFRIKSSFFSHWIQN